MSGIFLPKNKSCNARQPRLQSQAMSKDTDRILVLVEDMNHKFDVIMEYLKPLQTLPQQVKDLTERVDVMAGDIHIMKAVLTDQSRTLNNHENRIVHLENSITTP